jgi:hypothetical protein
LLLLAASLELDLASSVFEVERPFRNSPGCGNIRAGRTVDESPITLSAVVSFGISCKGLTGRFRYSAMQAERHRDVQTSALKNLTNFTPAL